ncbi:ABC transporter substrate-binding protein [Phytoactinopolyspora endophytica]|uniref:ABC transporter substrate-binding protein n=1 Tax=Phytoactinopolyspora endophytica TaxID=1642495 RepID=UPI00101E0128|nr:ABC transporter substrate-binding protein [Phytoactinopolyspora endophytica]
MVNMKVRAVTMAASAALGLAACTTGSSGGDDGGGSGGTDTIRTTLNAAPTTFTPWMVQNRDDYDLNRLLFNTLVRRGTDNEIVPALATSWETTPTSAELTLRDDATCADGTPITADVVKNSLQAMATAEVSVFREIVFGPGQPTISADNETNTVTIELAQPWLDLLQGLSLEATGIVCTAGLENTEELETGAVEGAFSGPYVLSNSSPGVSYTFTLREDYAAWPEYSDPAVEGEPAQTVEIDVVGNDSARANALLTGDMDIAAIRTEDMTRFEGEEGYGTHKLPSSSLYLLFNERPGSIFSDEAARRAVVQTLGREAFNSAATGGRGELATTFSHVAVPCASTDDSLLIEQDAAAAQQALSGQTIRVLGMDVIGPQGAGNSYVAEALREAGAQVELNNVDVATWSTTGSTQPGAWDVTVFPAINAGATMFGALSPIIGLPAEDGGANWSGVPHQEILTKVDQAMAEPDEQARCAIYQDIQETLIDEADVMPLSYLPAQVTVRPGFSVGVYNGQADISTMRIDDEG